jgi:hypothetical protein
MHEFKLYRRFKVYILIAVIALVGLGLWNYRAGVATLDAHSQYLKV